MSAAKALAPEVGVAPACAALAVPRASYYRRHRPPHDAADASMTAAPAEKPRPPLALTELERQEVLDLLHSERFVDQSPRQVWAALLDEQRYLCSVRTMYRILEAEQEVRERRRQRRHPNYQKPELLATAPNAVWSWDISKLKGPAKWNYYYLYVILDLFSRYVVGWMVARRESAQLAKRLIAESVEKQGIERDHLVVHADRGPSMTSKSVALLLSDLGVSKSHSRPYTSNDNPYPEAQFKTLKYHPSFPERFGSLEDARGFCRSFFTWYNTQHYHTGLGLLTPRSVHYGDAEEVLEQRQQALALAFDRHPTRFKGRTPVLPRLPKAVWINKPNTPEESQHDSAAVPSPEPPALPIPSFPLGRDERRRLNPEPAGGPLLAVPESPPEVFALLTK